jgi:hypothetical protein
VRTYVVGWRAVAEFGGEDVEDFAAAPALFAVCGVCEVVGCYASKAIVQKVRARPWVADGCDHYGRRLWEFFLRFGALDGLDDGESHARRGDATLAGQQREDAR